MRFILSLIIAVVAISTFGQEVTERELEAAVDTHLAGREKLVRIVLAGINNNPSLPARLVGVSGEPQNEASFKEKNEHYRKRLLVKRKCMDLVGTFRLEEATELLVQQILFSDDQKNAAIEPSELPEVKALLRIGKTASPSILKRLEAASDDFPSTPLQPTNKDGTVTTSDSISRHEAHVLIWTLIRIEGAEHATELLSLERHRAAQAMTVEVKSKAERLGK